MNSDDLCLFKQWFSDYCSSFHTSDDEDLQNLMLKEKHTANVCEHILNIARDESLDAGDAMIAEAIALFHDVGRFPQYAEYKTFRDRDSINHGELGAEVLSGSGILENIPVREREIITASVKFHNAFRIPDLENSDIIFFLKLVRDADKLDIWRIFFEYYTQASPAERPSAVALGFEDTPGYSKEVIDCIINKQLVSLATLETLNDFKLIQLSWVYDLNFRSSFRRATEGNYIDRIAATLPQTDEIRQAVASVHEYIQVKAQGDHDG
ncbi:MAG: HD domain-containing protein [Nitrospirae bacterium]|nr:HD domain-containing protein [Nitrospirota bacterium]